MKTFSRRQLMALAAGSLGVASLARRMDAADAVVTEIEVHQITPDYEDWIAYQLNHHFGPQHRSVYVAHTKNGLVGLGDGIHETEEIVKKYIGSNPFDWIGDETSLPLAMAMYDLMARSPGFQYIGYLGRSTDPGSP